MLSNNHHSRIERGDRGEDDRDRIELDGKIDGDTRMDRVHRRRIDLSHVLRVGALFADWRGPHRACTEPIAIAAGRHPTKYAETGKKICGRILTTRCYAQDVKNYIRAFPDLSPSPSPPPLLPVANIFIYIVNV